MNISTDQRVYCPHCGRDFKGLMGVYLHQIKNEPCLAAANAQLQQGQPNQPAQMQADPDEMQAEVPTVEQQVRQQLAHMEELQRQQIQQQDDMNIQHREDLLTTLRQEFDATRRQLEALRTDVQERQNAFQQAFQQQMEEHAQEFQDQDRQMDQHRNQMDNLRQSVDELMARVHDEENHAEEIITNIRNQLTNTGQRVLDEQEALNTEQALARREAQINMQNLLRAGEVAIATTQVLRGRIIRAQAIENELNQLRVPRIFRGRQHTTPIQVNNLEIQASGGQAIEVRVVEGIQDQEEMVQPTLANRVANWTGNVLHAFSFGLPAVNHMAIALWIRGIVESRFFVEYVRANWVNMWADFNTFLLSVSALWEATLNVFNVLLQAVYFLFSRVWKIIVVVVVVFGRLPRYCQQFVYYCGRSLKRMVRYCLMSLWSLLCSSVKYVFVFPEHDYQDNVPAFLRGLYDLLRSLFYLIQVLAISVVVVLAFTKLTESDEVPSHYVITSSLLSRKFIE